MKRNDCVILFLAMIFSFANFSAHAETPPSVNWQNKSYPLRKMGSLEWSDMATDAMHGLSSSFGKLGCGFTFGNAFTGSEKDRWRVAFEGVLTQGSSTLDSFVAPSGYVLRMANPKDAFNPLPVAVPLDLVGEVDRLTKDQPGTLYKDYTFLFLIEERRLSYGFWCEDVFFVDQIIPVGAKLDEKAVSDNFKAQVLLMREVLALTCKLYDSTHTVCRLL